MNKYIIILNLLFSSILTSSTAELCHQDDKKTLLQIKKSFNDVYEFASWTPNTDCCKDWYLVQCDERTNRITSLTVTNDIEVAGPIPDTVGNLPYLESLSFRNLPKLTGPLPKTLVNLKYLNSIWISKTNLSGSIPSFLGQIRNLDYVNLQNNNLNGPIPASLSNLRKLGYLALDGNYLTGPIPNSFGAFAKNPDFYLDLSWNKLTGPIPSSLGSIDLTELNLSRNKLSGNGAILFGKNKKLQRVNLSWNLFSFDITKVEFSKSLNIIDLSHNMIYGALPPTLSKIPSLQQFNVNYNSLCGKIPTGGELAKFDKSTYMHNKCLCGTPLPACKK